MAVVEIESDGVRQTRMLRGGDGATVPTPVEMNSNWFCRFLQRGVRGRFSFARCMDTNARVKMTDVPPIPGQRLVLDAAKKVGRLVEPLRETKNEGLLRQVVKFLDASGSVAGAGRRTSSRPKSSASNRPRWSSTSLRRTGPSPTTRRPGATG